MPPSTKDIHVLIPGTCGYCFKWSKNGAHVFILSSLLSIKDYPELFIESEMGPHAFFTKRRQRKLDKTDRETHGNWSDMVAIQQPQETIHKKDQALR